MTTAQKIKFAIENQGRKKVWIAKELGISRQLLDRKLVDNFFSVGEIFKLQQIGIL